MERRGGGTVRQNSATYRGGRLEREKTWPSAFKSINVCSANPMKAGDDLAPSLPEAEHMCTWRGAQRNQHRKTVKHFTSRFAHLFHGGRTERVKSSLAPLQHADGVETCRHILLHQAQPLPVRRNAKRAEPPRLTSGK